MGLPAGFVTQELYGSLSLTVCPDDVGAAGAENTLRDTPA